MGLMSIYNIPKQYKQTASFVSGPGESGSYLDPPCLSAHLVCDGTLTPVLSVAVRYFLKNKVSPDLCNEDGLTALHQVRLG